MPRSLCRLLLLTLCASPAVGARPTLDCAVTDTATSSVTRPLPSYRPGIALTLRAGTAGVGADITKSISRRLAVRLGANLFDYKGSLLSGSDSDDLQVGIDYTVKLNSFNLLLDFYPFQRAGFRLTGGVFYNLNQMTFFGKPTKDVKFNDVSFTPDEVGTLTGEATFQKLAPYVGIGWGHPFLRNRVKLALDMGFFYQYSPQITFATTGLLEPSSDQGVVIEQNLRPLKYYPVVNFGVSYNFSSVPRR